MFASTTVYLVIERTANGNDGTVVLASLDENTAQTACDRRNDADPYPVEPPRYTVIQRDLV